MDFHSALGVILPLGVGMRLSSGLAWVSRCAAMEARTVSRRFRGKFSFHDYRRCFY